MIVDDGTDNASFIMFNKDVTMILNMSATDLVHDTVIFCSFRNFD